MAKHGAAVAAQSNGEPFQLQEGRYGQFSSHVGTLKLKTDNGEHVVPESVLVDRSGPTPKFRYSMRRTMPFLRANDGSVDDLLASVTEFANDLVAFDATDTFALNGKVARKSYKLLVDDDGKSISVAQYIKDAIDGKHTLMNQQEMQKILRAKANNELYEELNVPRPTKKARAVKVEQAGKSVEIDDEA